MGGQELGDAAAVCSGVHVQHPRALERSRQLADLFDHVGADHRRVVVEVLLEQGDAVEHGHSGVPGTGISVNLSTDALRSGVPRQVQGDADAQPRPPPRWSAGLQRAGFDEITSLPLADGGEGTLDALVAARGGSRRHATVTGPLGDPVDAEWALLPGGVAVVEMAQASGLALVPRVRDPLRASTRGTGELIAAAIRAGARRVIVGVGGSATTDGGLAAWRRWAGRSARSPVSVACDVTTPFLDAATVFAPQKGATVAQVGLLTRRLASLAEQYEQRTGVDVRTLPGAGAAGGLAGGLAAIGAELELRLRRGRRRRRARRCARRRRPRGHGRGPPRQPRASRARWWAACSSGRPMPASPTSR